MLSIGSQKMLLAARGYSRMLLRMAYPAYVRNGTKTVGLSGLWTNALYTYLSNPNSKNQNHPTDSLGHQMDSKVEVPYTRKHPRTWVSAPCAPTFDKLHLYGAWCQHQWACNTPDQKVCKNPKKIAYEMTACLHFCVLPQKTCSCTTSCCQLFSLLEILLLCLTFLLDFLNLPPIVSLGIELLYLASILCISCRAIKFNEWLQKSALSWYSFWWISTPEFLIGFHSTNYSPCKNLSTAPHTFCLFNVAKNQLSHFYLFSAFRFPWAEISLSCTNCTDFKIISLLVLKAIPL